MLFPGGRNIAQTIQKTLFNTHKISSSMLDRYGIQGTHLNSSILARSIIPSQTAAQDIGMVFESVKWKWLFDCREAWAAVFSCPSSIPGTPTTKLGHHLHVRRLDTAFLLQQCVSLNSSSFVILYPEIKATEAIFSALKLYLCSFIIFRIAEQNWGNPKDHTVHRWKKRLKQQY